jgi:hypothetical protein
MKFNRLYIILFFLFIVSCKDENKAITSEDSISSEIVLESTSDNSLNTTAFDWLLGKWQRTNEKKENTETYEHWEKINDTYQGLGFTLKDTDTIWQEHMQLSKIDNSWQLAIKSPQEKVAALFKNLQLTEKDFTFENQDIEFPNIISYSNKENMFYATVSGSDMNIEFEFKRLE